MLDRVRACFPGGENDVLASERSSSTPRSHVASRRARAPSSRCRAGSRGRAAVARRAEGGPREVRCRLPAPRLRRRDRGCARAAGQGPSALDTASRSFCQPLVDRSAATLDQAVRVEDDDAPRGQLEPCCRYVAAESGSKRQAARGLDQLHSPVGVRDDRRRMSRGREAARAGVRLERQVRERREGGVEHLVGETVEPDEHGRRLQAVDRECPDRVSQLRHARGCLDALADDVADHEAELPVGKLEHVEPVAPDIEVGAAGQVAGRELDAVDARKGAREHTALQRLRDGLLGLVLTCALQRQTTLRRPSTGATRDLPR